MNDETPSRLMNVPLPKHVSDALNAEAERRGTTLSAVAVEVLTAFLEKHAKPPSPGRPAGHFYSCDCAECVAYRENI